MCKHIYTHTTSTYTPPLHPHLNHGICMFLDLFTHEHASTCCHVSAVDFDASFISHYMTIVFAFKHFHTARCFSSIIIFCYYNWCCSEYLSTYIFIQLYFSMVQIPKININVWEGTCILNFNRYTIICPQKKDVSIYIPSKNVKECLSQFL